MAAVQQLPGGAYLWQPPKASKKNVVVPTPLPSGMNPAYIMVPVPVPVEDSSRSSSDNEGDSKFGRMLRRLRPWQKVTLAVCGVMVAVGVLVCAVGVPAGAALIVIGVVGGAVVLGYAYLTHA